ncbi:MAG: hypothetical protein AAGA48_11620 [Myxococcota bacterium]
MTTRQLGFLSLWFVACTPEPLDPFGQAMEVEETGVPMVENTPCGPCGTGTVDSTGACFGALATPAENLVENAGSIEASTVFDDNLDLYGPELARDGDRGTSWFSAGPVDSTSVLTWRSPREDCLVGVRILNNRQHENTDFQEGFGFGQAVVRLFRVGAAMPAFETTVDLSATPDPDVEIVVESSDGEPGVYANRLEIAFSGHEDPTCGGISEVGVSALFD